jgi:uncharacterized membrane protein YccC
MNILSATRAFLRDFTRFDHSQITLTIAIRNTVGVVAPLAIAAATGHLLTGLSIAIGAINVAFSDQPGAYRARVGRMLLASLLGALSVFVGCTAGYIGWLAVLLAAAWAFGAGMLVALGPAAMQIGITAVILLLVFAGRPEPPEQAIQTAALILDGGLFQMLLAVAAWPVHPYAPQRDALAAVFARLAAYARQNLGAKGAPVATKEITNARQNLQGMGGARSTTPEALRALLDEAERIRLDLHALDDLRSQRVETGDDQVIMQCLDDALQAIAEIMEALAPRIRTGNPPCDIQPALERLNAANRTLRQHTAPGRVYEEILAGYLEALGSELRAVQAIMQTGTVDESSEAVPVGQHAGQGWVLLAILRANLTLQSATCRHAIRLAATIAVADVLAHVLNLPRTYWLPLTVTLVLRPDRTTTFTRGVGRMLGTLIGLVVSTVLAYIMFGSVAGRIALVGITMFVMRAFGAASFALLVICVTAQVVVLTSFAGSPPDATILARGIYTLAGGALALLAYAMWPTWERTQTPRLLALLLDSYRRYFTAVMAGYLDPARFDPAQVSATRQTSRLARSNMEASIDRLRTEARHTVTEIEHYESLLAASHRFARSTMVLEAGIEQSRTAVTLATLPGFVAAIDRTLQACAGTLRTATPLPSNLPDVLHAQQVLAEEAAAYKEAEHRSYWLAELVEETDRIAESACSMVALLRAPVSEATPDDAATPTVRTP